ncbi:tetratricopeptide repeat protein [Fimbriiglobus ruber]|uniref:tetratricopeptide repeat protein n=1 Tax=Fimbriiglobus ruber TaxID=1908690 RepID=UPI00117AB96B|nr:hypothetical protein [Fimbriiglobus ruber]
MALAELEAAGAAAQPPAPKSRNPRQPLSETAGIVFAPPEDPAEPTSADYGLSPDPEPVAPKAGKKVRKKAPVDDAPVTPAEPRQGRGGALVGGLAGLVAGVGTCAAVYFSGVVPNAEPSTAQTRSVSSVTPLGPPLAGGPVGPAPAPAGALDAHALLAAGDPAGALKVFDAAGDAATPAVKAARGRARWLTHVRELADAGTGAAQPGDQQLAKAEADLKAAAAATGTPEEKQAAAEAALHLGLIKEATGDVDAALAIYADAATRFPERKQWFEAAIRRAKAMRAGSNKTARLTPQQADILARGVVFALVLVQADAKPADPKAAADKPADDEPGFLFWEAVSLAADKKYPEAVEAIGKARAIHDKRRLKLAGRGLNPLSDPLEQIFLRSCDEMKAAWTLDNQLYGDPTLGTTLAKVGVPKFLADYTALVEGQKKYALELKDKTDKLAAQEAKTEEVTAKLGEADKKLGEVDKKLLETDKKLKAATDDLAKAVADKDGTAKDLTDAKKALTDADAKAADALKKAKDADDRFAAVVKELKSNKLLDEKDDTAAVLAKLPDVLRKAAATAVSGDAKKAAEALLAAKKEADTLRADAEKAREAVAKAEVMATKAMDDAAKAVDAARGETKDALAKTAAEVKKAVDTTKAAAASEQAALKLKADEATQAAAKAQTETAQRVAQAEKDAALKLAQRDEETRRLLADARAGIVVPLTSAELEAKVRAGQIYGAGVELYFESRYAEAETALARATQTDGTDARFWYFLGLAQSAQGKSPEAAFKRGVELENRNQPVAKLIAADLERVQGPARQALAAYRR